MERVRVVLSGFTTASNVSNKLTGYWVSLLNSCLAETLGEKTSEPAVISVASHRNTDDTTGKV